MDVRISLASATPSTLRTMQLLVPLQPARLIHSSWETIFSKSSEVVLPQELLCCRRLVQLCRDCLLVVYKFVSESRGSLTGLSPEWDDTRRQQLRFGVRELLKHICFVLADMEAERLTSSPHLRIRAMISLSTALFFSSQEHRKGLRLHRVLCSFTTRALRIAPSGTQEADATRRHFRSKRSI
ncbi:Tubulin polyglutamylase TTLL7 [Liparis tanakae]|uniref:Tubulin polyglutamylase TTLL7 n=1 Tax=Liparis tanakae TaxID=230148 RepID=A0A4Z2J132_9TELE|nr:Tubulin polyglutamylase TTLL7 [Liparis tanakae]